MRILSFGEWDAKVNALRFSYFAGMALMQETSSTSLSMIWETPGTQKIRAWKAPETPAEQPRESVQHLLRFTCVTLFAIVLEDV